MLLLLLLGRAGEKQSAEKRRPEVLVLTGSALRALELIRQLPSFGRGCRIQKLFAKHMKVYMGDASSHVDPSVTLQTVQQREPKDD